jgi:hypothetical protein
VSKFSDFIAAGLERIREHAGVSVTYARGANAVTLSAVVGITEHTSLDDAGMPVTHQSRDYLIAVGDLVLGGSAVEPLAGDRITEGSAAYVVRNSGGDAPWRYSDGARTTFRVHTVEVS